MEYFDLDVWKQARILVNKVYLLTNKYPKEEVYGLTSQIRRSVISIPSNIAEGCGRNTPKDTLRFLYIARGSMYELETQLCLSSDLKYITDFELKKILELIQKNKMVLSGFIKYYKKIER